MRTWLSATLCLLCFAGAAAAEEAPRLEVSGGYTYVHANAPPGDCGCFSLNGGNGELAYKLTHHIGLVGDLALVHNGSIANGSGSGVNLTSYTFGPRYSLPIGGLAPFTHILIGGAHESAGQISNSAFAMNLGGGLDYRVNRRWSVRIIEADYYLTKFSNPVNSRQNNLRIGAGVVFKF